MKKILLSLFSLLCVAYTYAISLNGIEYTIDTLSMFPAGPGTTYYELRLLRADNGKGRLDAYLLAVDTRNPYVQVQQVLGTGKVTGCEVPSSMAKRSTTDKEIYFGGVNGGFFAYQAPVGTTVINSQFALTPAGAGGGRRHGGIDADGRGVTAYTHTYSMKAIMPYDTVLTIHHVNDYRDENQLVLFNHHLGANTGSNAYGTEVKIQLLEGESWKTTGTMKVKVLDKQENVGSMPLAADYAVLSGHGSMQKELNKLNVGDEITLAFEMRLDDELVNVAQLIGGDHYEAMILDKGKVAQSGFWNELHPRTGFGVSQTRDTTFMIVIDGRGVSTGCTTKVMAEILQHYGAWNAVNWDGGGSSCLYVRPFDQMNNGSDGSERAVTNAMFAVAHVPEVDNEVVTIAPYMHNNYYLPHYGVDAPQFLGYNKYGVLVETNVKDVQLSCAPEVGEILPDGRFFASSEKGGKLIATWGDITTELNVRVSSSAPIAIRLDTVLCGSQPYKVEVEGTVDNNTVEILSSALTWSSADPSIATVDDEGLVVGQRNGMVVVTGKLGSFTDQIVIKVELPESDPLIWDDFRNVASWEVKASSTDYNPSIVVPENAPVNLKFTYTGGRVPFVQLSKDSLLYSTPDKICVPLTTNATFEKVVVMIRANNSTTTDQITFLNPKVGEANLLEIDVKEHFGDDVAIYPLRFLALKMIPSSATPKDECYVTLPGIIEVFSKEGLESILSQCQVNISSNNPNAGTVKGSGVFDYGTYTEISATANYGYYFSHWNDGNTDNPRVIQVTKDKTYTAYFEKNTYTVSVDYNSAYGTITGPTSGEYLDELTLTVTPNLGYCFTGWSDGVKDNPRTIVLTKDLTLTANFAQAYSGKCGDNLYWKYDSDTKTIAITGSGNMYNYTASTQPWILFKEQILKVEVANEATSLGASAFEGCVRLGEVHIGQGLEFIYENVFAACNRLYHVYCYPTYPPFAVESSFSNYNVYLHIPCHIKEGYELDMVWGLFKYIQCLGAETDEEVPEGEVTTTTTNTSVTITWPTEENADSYTIEIKKGDKVFCTLTFTKDGQLTNIAFAPGRDGQNRIQYAEMTAKGLRFTVTSLDAGTQYSYDVTTKDKDKNIIASYSGEFTTKSDVTTDIDNVTSTTNCQKLFRDGHLLIIRDGKTYNAQGVEL